MLLSDFFSILATRGINQITAESYMQDAYDMVVKKIRLDKSIHPLRLMEAGHMGGFKHPVILSPSGSKMAFKQVSAWLKCSLTQEDVPEGYIASDIVSVDPANSNVYAALYSSSDNSTVYVNGTDIVPVVSDDANITLDITYDNDNIEVSEIDDSSDIYPIVDEDEEGDNTCILVSGYVYPYPLLVGE